MQNDTPHRIDLDNGCMALLVERRDLPLCASMLWYRVGSRNERSGETGVSHFLEHMMFKGTERYAKGEIDLLTAKMGGSNNAFTDNDVTAYYFSLASDRWQVALEIEASRMHGCLLDEAEFAAEKSVVLEELAMGEDNPWSMLHQAVESLMFQVHPYRHPVIGWRGDLEHLTVDMMRDYYRRHYAADRSFLVVVGDIDVQATTDRIGELFGGFERIGTDDSHILPEPPQQGERRATIRFPGTIQRLAIAVRTCRMGERDDFVLDLISVALGGGKSSRLHRSLVIDAALVTSVSTANEVRADPGVFWIMCELVPGADRSRVEAMIRSEIDKLCARGLTVGELRRSRSQIAASLMFESETALGLATRIGRFSAMTPAGLRLLASIPAIYDEIDNAEVKVVARRHLSSSAFNVVWSLPENGDGR